MDLDETATSTDAEDGPQSHPWRMAHASTVHIMAPAMQPCNLKAGGEFNNFPYPETKRPNIQDFIRFLKQKRWKLYQTAKRKAHVGNFLTTIDTANT